MMGTTASTIPYHLRVHKAIDRNLFISLLKKLDRCTDIYIDTYRYVGFGAPFLEDFKSMHMELGICKMDCLECEEYAATRQNFNNPYSFIDIYECLSTSYITGADFKQDKHQIIWLDFASPNMLAQQLVDLELLSEKLASLDILKVTFNASLEAFITSYHVPENPKSEPFKTDLGRALEFIKEHEVFSNYFPDHFTIKNVGPDFSVLLRAMAIRAINRGLVKANGNLSFNHIASFTYADGQKMTTMCGIFTEANGITKILGESKLDKWEFYKGNQKDEIIQATKIMVPSMTILERTTIDKLLSKNSAEKIAKKIKFKYGEKESEHLNFIKGYRSFYKYLPYFSKITY